MEFRHPLKIPAVDNGKLNEDDPLIRAIKANNLETVQFLIETNDGKYKDPTFSMTTIENENLNIMESMSFIKRSFHSSPSRQKKTPLLYAVESGNLEIIKLLLKYKPRIQEDPELLITAVSQKNVELVELLIHHGANVNAKSQEGPTPLSQAVAVANIEMTKLLISNGADLKNDTESLSLAVAVDSNDIVEILLQNGANPNAKSQGMNLEIFRSVCAALSMLGMGIARSCPKLSKKKLQKGRTALHLAADLGREEPLRLLLAYGADVDCKTFQGLTPLIIAADRGHGDIVQVLLESDAAMDIADEFERTAFHAAVSRERWDILVILLEFCFNKPEILLGSGIHRLSQDQVFSEIVNQILANDRQYNKLETWKRSVFMCKGYLLKAHAAEVKVGTSTNFQTEINALAVSESKDFDAYTLEIQTLKTQYIGDSDVTFFQLLVADLNSLAVLARNDSINSGLKLAVITAKFPSYWSLLMSQLRKGVARRDLMERGIALSPRLVPDFQLPDLVVERVLQYLSNKDINAFIGACSRLK